jgi:hypothetical protein
MVSNSLDTINKVFSIMTITYEYSVFLFELYYIEAWLASFVVCLYEHCSLKRERIWFSLHCNNTRLVLGALIIMYTFHSFSWNGNTLASLVPGIYENVDRMLHKIQVNSATLLLQRVNPSIFKTTQKFL